MTIWYEDSTGLGYAFMRRLFHHTVEVFYHTVEVFDPTNVPQPGSCTIMCPSHGNSLTDALVVTACSPRMVRLTAKDSLWKHPFFSLFVRGVGTIPIQRRTEHGEKADNSVAFGSLYRALEKGQCACLFPEGISRYMSGLAPLKTGVGHIALEVLKRRFEAGDLDFECSIVPCAITYLHREKFRSDVCVICCEPVRLRAADYPTLVDGSAESAKSTAKNIVERVATQLRTFSISAPNWEISRAAHVARRLYLRPGACLSLKQFVTLTQRFVGVFVAALGPAKAEEMRRKRSDSDPDVPPPPEPPAGRGDEVANGLLTSDLTGLSEALLAYQDKLERLGLGDEHIYYAQPPALWLRLAAGARLLWGAILLLLASPGAILLSPLLVGGKLSEIYLQEMNMPPPGGNGRRRVRNMDEVAQYKMGLGVVLFLPITASAVAVLRVFGSLSWPAAALCGPALLWLSVRLLEDAVACLRYGFEDRRLLQHEKEAAELRLLRKELAERVQKAAVLFGLPTAQELARQAPSDSWLLSYFNPKRRRRREWGEVLQFWRIELPYPQQVLRRGHRLLDP